MSTANAELQQKLRDYLKAKGISQNKFAPIFGYSGANISNYLSDKFIGNIEKFESKLAEFFKNQDDAKEIKSSIIDNDYRETSISTNIFDVIRICHLQGGLTIGCGDAGIGKTMACLHYLAKYPNTSYMITANACFSNLSAFLGKICDCINIKPHSRRLSDMWNALAEEFSGEKKVLIIDEAQFLTVRVIETLRALSDQNPNFGICLVGNIDIISNIYNARDQLRNRTKFIEIHHTSEITDNDIKLIFTAIKDDEKSVNLMLGVARSIHGLRGAVNVFNTAINTDDISYSGLLEHIKRLPKKIF